MARKVIDVVSKQEAGPAAVLPLKKKKTAAQKQANEQYRLEKPIAVRIEKQVFPESEPDIEPDPAVHKKKKRANPRAVKHKIKQGRGKPFFARLTALVLAVLICCGFVYLYFFYNRAVLLVYPKSEEISAKQEIKISVSQDKADWQNGILPGRILQTEVEQNMDFQTEGRGMESGKSGGVIYIYNSVSPVKAVPLAASTRFLSAKNSKIFRLKQKIVLPAATMKNNKVVPSVIEATVEAQEEGGDYNIDPTKFSVPGLVGSVLYYNIWAESKNKMSGGFSDEVSKISSGDLLNAQSRLKGDLAKKALADLGSRLPSGFILSDKAFSIDSFEFSCDQSEGAKSENFTCSGRMKARVLIFKEADIKETARNLLSRTLPSFKELSATSLAYEFLPKGAITDQGNLFLDFSAKSRSFDSINSQAILSGILGKGKETALSIIKQSNPQIENVSFKFWPIFFAHSLPKDSERISVKIVDF
ncbi:MAG: hypothetical protein M1127_01900 [Patescibacteria group bacterium]|nr:hypothetical protein [Patescibacteria group bacterium]